MGQSATSPGAKPTVIRPGEFIEIIPPEEKCTDRHAARCTEDSLLCDEALVADLMIDHDPVNVFRYCIFMILNSTLLFMLRFSSELLGTIGEDSP